MTPRETQPQVVGNHVTAGMTSHTSPGTHTAVQRGEKAQHQQGCLQEALVEQASTALRNGLVSTCQGVGSHTGSKRDLVSLPLHLGRAPQVCQHPCSGEPDSSGLSRLRWTGLWAGSSAEHCRSSFQASDPFPQAVLVQHRAVWVGRDR